MLGLAVLESYVARPGAQAAAPGFWPDDSVVERSDGSYQLVVALHPRCPCSLATVQELGRLLARVGSGLSCEVLIYRPEAEPAAWSESRLQDSVASLSGAVLRDDPEGREALRFGALTSGQVVLFGPDGELLFQGGLTSARGHEGLTVASREIAALVRAESGTPIAGAPVFGCPLHEIPATGPGQED